MNERIPLFSRPLPVVILIQLALLLDQAVKFAVETWLPFQEPVHVMPMLALYRTYNYGVAFSMLSGMEGWFIVTLRLFGRSPIGGAPGLAGEDRGDQADGAVRDEQQGRTHPAEAQEEQRREERGEPGDHGRDLVRE